jgi:phosphonate transport system substrate-binding protein
MLMGLLQVRISLTITDSYEELLQVLGSGEAHFAWLPPAVYVRARREFGAHLMVAGVRSEQPQFCGSIFVHAQHPAQSIADLKGCRIGWVDPFSCSGFLFPREAIRAAGFNPGTHFAKETFLGDHASVAKAVALGAIDAGATFIHLDRASNPGWALEVDPSIMRPLLVTESIPADVIAAGPSVDPKLRQRFSIYLSEIHSSDAGLRLLERVFGAQRFEPIDARCYEPVERALKNESLEKE